MVCKDSVKAKKIFKTFRSAGERQCPSTFEMLPQPLHVYLVLIRDKRQWK
jgi:hypothetical protein